MSASYLAFKRLIDIAVSASSLIILSPLLIAITSAVLISDGAPVFFRQARPGLRGRPFQLVKFRTMRPPPRESSVPTSDEQRLTRLGKLLRSTSFDELPELWNVLIGDMSLVGPRPLLMEYLPLYSPEQARRHEVRPGITGWAQVNGRNALSWEEKFKLDVWYVNHCSMLVDLKIIARTVATVFMRLCRPFVEIRATAAPRHAETGHLWRRRVW
jgi:lipopolysaccharide/colanic/teichoic acid biosynthesis glycosyltransferase